MCTKAVESLLLLLLGEVPHVTSTTRGSAVRHVPNWTRPPQTTVCATHHIAVLLLLFLSVASNNGKGRSGQALSVGGLVRVGKVGVDVVLGGILAVVGLGVGSTTIMSVGAMLGADERGGTVASNAFVSSSLLSLLFNNTKGITTATATAARHSNRTMMHHHTFRWRRSSS